MTRKRLAAQLLAQTAEKGRRLLLASNRRIADTKLALAIMHECYDAWASDPTRTQKAARAISSLWKFNPSPQIKPYASWVSGISDLTRGRLKSASENLESASNDFLALGQEHDSAQPMVARLMALGMLGLYDDAIAVGNGAIVIFEKYGDEVAAGKIQVNLSNIVARREMHREAIDYCLSAVARFTKFGETWLLTAAQHDLAREYTQINDFGSAERFFELALVNARNARMGVTEAEILASMSNLALFRGNYAEALSLMETSRRKYQDLRMPNELAIAELEIADIYSEINLPEEAYEIYSSVVRLLRRLKMGREEAWARANLARTAITLGKSSVANREFRGADKLFKAQGNQVARAFIKLDQASLALKQLKFERSLQLLDEASIDLRESEHARTLLSATWLRAEILRNLGRVGDARILLSELLQKAVRAEYRTIEGACLNSLGRIAGMSDETSLAAAYFRRAIKIVEQSRTAFGGEQFRRAFMGNRLEPFVNMARLYLSKGRVSSGFDFVERAKSRSLFESVLDTSRGCVRRSNNKPIDKRAADLRRELNWLYKRQTNQSSSEIATLQTKVLRTEKELAQLERGLDAVDVKATKRGSRVSTVSLGDLKRRIGPRRALVEFVVFDGILSAFIITNTSLLFHEGLAKEAEIAEVLEGLNFQFDGMRYGYAAGANFQSQITARIERHLKDLYDKLLRPLEAHLKERHLIIVPAAVLHHIPFQALHDGNQYVVESREVQYAPSASIWLSLENRPKRKFENALLMGFADEKIPSVNEEIRVLKKILPNPKSFIGGQACFSKYLANAPGHDILHLACHGQFRPENPMFSSLHLADGWLTVSDICSQELNADLVTLSACETGRSTVYAGEELLGLPRGFLAAGARAVIVSLWRVDDKTTREFMEEFYELLQLGSTVGASLREVQISCIRRSVSPYYWSPFVLIGA